jgi:hypothetical protein
MKEDKFIVFFHIATIGNYREIVNEIINHLEDSGLLNEAYKIYFSVVGSGEVDLPLNNNCSISYDLDLNFGEFITLTKLKNLADFIESNVKILYIHTKGATSDPSSQPIKDWRKYMLHFNVDKYLDMLNYLDSHDACGVDFVEDPAKHFSGNFWWANSYYIKTLPKIEDVSSPFSKTILTLRHNAEFWIGMGKGKIKSIHNSAINVYQRHLTEYPKEKYNRL